MANGTGDGGASPIQKTAIVGSTGGAATAVAIFLCSPTWPPPADIISIVVGTSLPAVHLIGRGIMRWLAKKFGEPDANGNGAAPAPAPAPVPPPAPGAAP